MSDDLVWTYEARVTSPTGVTISAVIELPECYAGPDSLELLEVAQMATARMAGMTKSITRSPYQSVLNCGKHIAGSGNLRCVLRPGHDEPCAEVPF
jgi:allophanate hydrolase subunit 1